MGRLPPRGEGDGAGCVPLFNFVYAYKGVEGGGKVEEQMGEWGRRQVPS